MNKRIIVSGVGLVSSLGIGHEQFWLNLTSGKSGIRPISLFETNEFKTQLAGEIPVFDPKDYIDPKGLKFMNRSTQMGLVAAHLALKDANLLIEEHQEHDLGLVVGTSHCHLESIAKIKAATRKDPLNISPMEGPNGIVNIVASQLAIRHKTKSFNVTLSNGYTDGIDAIVYGCQAIKNGIANRVLVGCVETLSYEQFYCLHHINEMAGMHGDLPAISAPFDKRRNGIIPGEGCAFFVIEDEELVQKRKTQSYGSISGYGKRFTSPNSQNSLGSGVAKTMEQAIQSAGLTESEIGFISASANSDIVLDKLECEAINSIMSNKPLVGSIKGSVGECQSASGSFQCASMFLSLKNNMLPPMINYQFPDPDCHLNFATDSEGAENINHILINNISKHGHQSSLVLSRH